MTPIDFEIKRSKVKVTFR